MPKQLTHEEISQRFVDAKVVDYAAMGQLIAEIGPSLAINDHGVHGVAFGRFNTLACMMPAVDLGRLIGNLRGAGLTAAAIDAGADVGAAK
ncbi:hypothetical protein [Ideonella sp. A 288]|uniref:hypothetical protein n=1 Tax=Ideonella sp. A 288 TaxID=1962181 RepID=UPI000B4B9C2F|nr:hypothetical protein [Ideonella sp. A 288]